MKKLAIIVGAIVAILGSVFYLVSASGTAESNIYTYIDEATLEQKINNSETFVVYIYGKNCSYCKAFAPTIEGYLEQNKFQINKIASDDSPNIKTLIGDTYQGTPSIYVFKEGVISDYMIGQKTEKELSAFVTKNSSVFETHRIK